MTVVMSMVMKAARRGHNRRIPREDLRARIFTAALALFRETGYDATTVEAIARRAKVAKGTLFNFFPTKSAVLLAHYETADRRFGEALDAMRPDDPRAALSRFFATAERLLREEGPLVDAIVRETFLDAGLRRADRASGRRDRERMTAFLRACQEQGTLDRTHDPQVAADVVIDLWSATALEWVREGREFPLRKRLLAKIDVVLDGLATGGRRAR